MDDTARSQPSDSVSTLPPFPVGQRARDWRRHGERIDRLLHALDALPVFVTYVDDDRRYQFANLAYAERFRRPPHYLVGRTVREVVGEESYAIMAPYIDRALAGEQLRYERRIRGLDGEPRWIEALYVPDRRDGGQVVGFVALITDITERREAADERERLLAREQAALLEAQAALSVRDQFLSTAAHELRTPLTTIKGYVQYLERMIVDNEPDRERQLRFVGHLTRQIGRFERLVADLLDVARLQRGQLDLHLERVDLVALAREVIARTRLLPECLPSHEFLFEGPDVLWGQWDLGRIDQVLTNLLSNAVKYSPDGGIVQVTVRRSDASATVSVQDHGVGMHRSASIGPFRPFARGEAAHGRIGGLGLGLFICAQIVEQHRGTLTLQCEPLRGCLATVTLPLD